MFADFYKEYERAKELEKEVPEIKGFNKVIFCGVGGSSMPGEIISSLNSIIKIPSFIAREKLPLWVDKQTLCFIISYSGNTKETIELYNKAKKKKAKIIIITSGGRLSKKPESKIIIPKGFLPREALPYFLFPVLKIIGIKQDIKKPKITKKEEQKIQKIINKLSIKDKIPLIYSSSEELKSVSYIWKTQLNENSKTFSHSNYFPELLHNEIESNFPKNSIPILLKNSKLSYSVSNKIKKIKNLEFLNPIEISLKGKNLLDKVIYGIYLGERISYFVAKNKKVKWKEIPKIKKLK